jgi:hypothetical protein
MLCTDHMCHADHRTEDSSIAGAEAVGYNTQPLTLNAWGAGKDEYHGPLSPGGENEQAEHP